MRIGIIVHPYDEDKPAGLARTIFELTKGMLAIDTKNEYVIFLKNSPCTPPDLPGSFRIEVLGGRALWLERLRTALPADVYIFNTPMMPLFWKPPYSVVLALDFAYWYLAPRTIRGQLSKWFTFALHAVALRRADIVVAISEATKKDLLTLFKTSGRKIKVVYCGFKKICEVPEKKKELPHKFFFFAGIIKQRKNVLNIIKAFHIFMKKNPGYTLVIGGNGSGEYYEAVQHYIRENNLSKEIFLVGHLDDGELSYIYKRAEGLVFPTLIEGFGYPVLEAMDCGIPVITSNQSSLQEIGGNGSALLVNPYDTEDIASAMERIAKESGLRATLKERGFAQAGLFSWKKAAEAMVAVIQDGAVRIKHPVKRINPMFGKKTIMMTISRGILIRNFFHSGVVRKLLDNGLRVVVVVPANWDLSVFKEYEHPSLYFERMPDPGKPHLKRLLDLSSYGAIFNSTVYVRYKYSFVGKTPTKSSFVLNMLFFAPMRAIPFMKQTVRFIERRVTSGRECDFLMERYKPSLVFNTIAGQSFNLMKSAQRHGATTIEMPKSWDTASYMLFRVKADYAFAWGPFMRDQLVRFQDYAPDKIIMTGTAQFDFFTRKEYLINREKFCEKFNFNPKKKIILYASLGADCLDEKDYIQLLLHYIESGVLRDTQILVRPHLKYKGDSARFIPFEKEGVLAVDRSDNQDISLRDNWDPSMGHNLHLFNSLYHADACVTTISTIMLDATACGTPVVNINFDVKKNISPHRSIKRFYMTDYIKAVMRTGGTWITKNEKEFLDALKDILEHGTRREEGRERLIQHIMYKNDGQAAKRIALTLARLAQL